MTPETNTALAETNATYTPADRDETARRDWLHLANIQFSARRLGAFLEAFQNDPSSLLNASDAELEDAGCQAKHITRLRDPAARPTTRQIAWTEKHGVRIVLRDDSEYPRLLREIHDPPPLLFVRGTLDEADRFSVGMVGSRRATSYGKGVAERLAKELAERGLTIVSGGAVGIDAASHRGALSGGGRTIAVLGCGLDVDYPRENGALFERVMAQGALVTEYPIGAQPESWRFPARNRLISGMSLGTLVVEAPKQSGALITAKYAAEHNRTVLTVPGNIDRMTSAGSNELLRDGVIPVLEVEDILHGLGLVTLPAQRRHQQSLPLDTAETNATEEGAEPSGASSASRTPAQFNTRHNLPRSQQQLLECLELTPLHIDTVAKAAGLSATQAGIEMTMLELAGLVRRLPGNSYIRLL